jgi:hypothetical protein
MQTVNRIFITALSLFTIGVADLASAEVVTYTYDFMQRVIRAQYASGPAIEYVYDKMGNRTIRRGHAAAIPANTPPNQATSPSPVNNVVGVSGPLTMSWSGSDPNQGDRLSYIIQIGTASNALVPIWSGSQTSFAPWMLQAGTTYYWMVVTRDSHNAETAGPVWRFTTGPATVNPLPVNLDVSLAGTGSGSVTSTNPTGIACTGLPTDDCVEDFALNTMVTLYSVASSSSRFKGWSVESCPAVQSIDPPYGLVPPAACTFAMTADTAVSATFDQIPPIRILLPDLIYFPPYEMDNFVSASGIVQSFGTYLQYSMTMQSHNKIFIEDVSIDSGSQDLLWQGGYSDDYSSVTGTTRIQGSLTILGGRLIVDRLEIR